VQRRTKLAQPAKPTETTVPATEIAYTGAKINRLLAAIREQEAVRRDGCAWVFPSPLGDDAPASFHSPFSDARKHAGLDKRDARGEALVVHSLRHSAATEAGRNGATAFEIAALTGHRTLAMVQRYTKTDETHALAALTKRAQR
jgi:integrase